MQEIKECPYCGRNKCYAHQWYFGQNPGFRVTCFYCGVTGALGDSKQNAIGKWNALTRKSDIERLEAQLTQQEKELNWLADALVSPFINPDDRKDREY